MDARTRAHTLTHAATERRPRQHGDGGRWIDSPRPRHVFLPFDPFHTVKGIIHFRGKASVNEQAGEETSFVFLVSLFRSREITSRGKKLGKGKMTRVTQCDAAVS